MLKAISISGIPLTEILTISFRNAPPSDNWFTHEMEDILGEIRAGADYKDEGNTFY
jgi:hypothetical protein